MKRVAIFVNTEKPEAVKWAELAAKKLKSYGSECCATDEIISSFDEDIQGAFRNIAVKDIEKFADVILTFGGDGTMLSVARKMIDYDIPLLGFNVGKLGFLAEFSVDALDETLKEVMEGNYRMVDRAVLETEIDGRTIYALNDFVVEKEKTAKMITVKTYTDEHYVGAYRANGVILTTPTGSTAYSLSCYGPIIAPSTTVLCITPVSPHTMTLRPLVIPDTIEVTFKVVSSEGTAVLVADGKNEHEFKYEESILVKKSEKRIKLIKPKNSSYYDLLRNKLLWATNALQEEEDIKRIDGN